MAKAIDQEKINWRKRIEKITFGLEEERPIKLIRHNFKQKQDRRYDMHYGFELGVLLSGKMKRHFKNYSFNVLPGQIWLCGMWEPHGWEVSQAPCQAVVFIIFPPLIARTYFGTIKTSHLFHSFNIPPLDRPQAKGETARNILNIARSLKTNFSTKEDLNTTWIYLKLSEILLTLQKGCDINSYTSKAYLDSFTRINKAVQLIFENKRFITTQEAAKICGINRNYFSKIFESIMGVSFSEFALRFRVSSAAQELINTDKRIKTIASEWGFTDTSHFHRCFIKYYKMNTSQYRTGNICQ